jgi:glycine cleavage system H protein
MSNVPEGLKYTESHEWVQFKDGKAVVGITDHAQEELTDIVFVELPEVGAECEAGKQILVVESVKAASDIYAPVSGKITAVNSALEDEPGLLNSDPYSNGWLFEVETSDDGANLLDAEAYKGLI